MAVDPQQSTRAPRIRLGMVGGGAGVFFMSNCNRDSGCAKVSIPAKSSDKIRAASWVW